MGVEINSINLGNCFDLLPSIPDNYFDMTLTDIPYGRVNHKSNGLRKIDKGKANTINFDLSDFTKHISRVTKSTVIIFCGKEQLSSIYHFFDGLQRKNVGTTRQLVWVKTNPIPMNGKHVYLSGIENAVWFKKRNGTFNAFCQNTYFEYEDSKDKDVDIVCRYPNGTSKRHPTEKNHKLLKSLIEQNSNENDVIFDPCCGSGSHLSVAKAMARRYYGIEVDKEYYEIAKNSVSPIK